MGGRRHGLRCVTAPALDFGILTETKDSETGTVESSFTVTSAYTAEAWKYLENLAEVQEREVGCLVEKIVDETDGNPYPLPYFREQDLAAEDARAARISNAMTRKVAFELTRLAIPYEFRFEEEAADDERLSEIWDM